MKTVKDRSQKKPQTGMAGRIREELKGKSRPIAYSTLYKALGIKPGTDKKKAIGTIHDFINRGEITKTPTGLIKYNHEWKRKSTCPIKNKILKAMYVSNNIFSSSDIQRLSEADSSYIDEEIKKLFEKGYLERVGRRRCDNPTGVEWLYIVSDRVKFRLEVME